MDFSPPSSSFDHKNESYKISLIQFTFSHPFYVVFIWFFAVLNFFGWENKVVYARWLLLLVFFLFFPAIAWSIELLFMSVRRCFVLPDSFTGFPCLNLVKSRYKRFCCFVICFGLSFQFYLVFYVIVLAENCSAVLSVDWMVINV